MDNKKEKQKNIVKIKTVRMYFRNNIGKCNDSFKMN